MSCSALLPRQAAFRESRALQGICFSRLYLGQTLVQTLPLAQHEYINAYGTDSWRETIRESHEQSADHTSPDSPIANLGAGTGSGSGPSPCSHGGIGACPTRD